MTNPWDYDESQPNRYEAMSISEIIEEALDRLDRVELTPDQAKQILDFRLAQLQLFLEDECIEPDDFVSDEEFALADIADGDAPQHFGPVYRKYHVSSEGQPFMGGVRETALAADYEGGGIWIEIDLWNKTHRPS